MLLAVNSNNKSAIKLKKGNPQNRNLQKTSQKNKQISIKTSPKTSNSQVFKKTRNSTKKQAQICGKTARLATLLQMWVANVASGLFYCWSLLCNNIMATNLQRFTYYGGRRFVSWDYWTQTSWQVMQRDNDMMIAVRHVYLYFVKTSTSGSIAMLQQVWKIHY